MGSRNLSFRRFVLQAVAVLKVVCSCFLPGEIIQEKDQNEHVKKFKAFLKDVSIQFPGNHWFFEVLFTGIIPRKLQRNQAPGRLKPCYGYVSARRKPHGVSSAQALWMLALRGAWGLGKQPFKGCLRILKIPAHPTEMSSVYNGT